MFLIDFLPVNSVQKMRFIINEIIITCNKKNYHPEKNFLFSIIYFVDKLYYTNSNKPSKKKNYFSDNQVSNLLLKEKNVFSQQTYLYNKLIKKQSIFNIMNNKTIITKILL